MTDTMHADEVRTDAALVTRLLAEQFPQWAGLPVERVRSDGTDNALYRIGEHLVARLPRIGWAIGQVEKEATWLPRLAPHLPLQIPAPVAVGTPAAGYPWSWSICPWVVGENATLESMSDPQQVARDLAGFITALQRIDTTGGPRPGANNSGRGVPLANRDAETRTSLVELAKLPGMVDVVAATQAWEAALSAAVWTGPPVWLHGDLHSGNLLLSEGVLSAVIDFGCLGVGDPACDLMPAWNLFTAQSRVAFRAALDVDDATWARGRGWALSFALNALSYYYRTNPSLSAISRHAIAEVLSDTAG